MILILPIEFDDDIEPELLFRDAFPLERTPVARDRRAGSRLVEMLVSAVVADGHPARGRSATGFGASAMW